MCSACFPGNGLLFLPQVPGLWVCGNFRSGVSIPDCVAFGRSQAKVVADFLVNDKGL